MFKGINALDTKEEGYRRKHIHVVFVKQPFAMLLLAEGMAFKGLKCQVYQNTSASVAVEGGWLLGQESDGNSYGFTQQ